MKWGIIGLGKIAKKFAEALSLLEGAELYAVASRSASKAKAFSDQHQSTKYYDSYEALVQDPEVDFIYVAIPHAFHKDCTLLALKNKKPVLCEKPMAHKWSDVKEMVETSKREQVFLMEAMWTRFLPPIHKAMELIASGAIGQVEKVKADFGFNTPFDEKSRLYDMSLGGGSLMDVGVYPLFLALTLLGKPNSIKASANLASTGADKDCTIELGYETASAFLQSSIIKDTPREAIIVGSEGEIKFIPPWYHPTSLLVKKKNGEETKIEFGYKGNGFEAQIREVMESVKNGKIESPKMAHSFSLLQSEVLDEVCKQCAIVYP